MPLDETVATFSYLISEMEKMGIAYVNLARHLDDYDPEFDGKKRGTRHDIVETYSHLLKLVRVFADGGYTAEEAVAAVKGWSCCLR